ncbi:hypothetical protein ACQP3C_28420, partial [Escherichia coli]
LSFSVVIQELVGGRETSSYKRVSDILETPAALYRKEGTRVCSKKGVITVLFYLRLELKIKFIIYLYFP